MIHHSCLPLPAEQLMLSQGQSVLVFLFMLAALAVSALLAPLMRRRYRQKVTRLMGMNQLMPQVHEDAAPDEQPERPRHALDAKRLYSLAEQGELRIRRATAVAYLTFILVPLLMQVLTLNPVEDVLEFMVGAAVMGAAPAHSNWPSRRLWRKRAMVFGAIAMGVASSFLAWPETPQEVAENPAYLAVLFGLAFGATFYVTFHRSLRGQMLPIFCIVLTWTLTTAAVVGLGQQYLGTCWQRMTSAEGGVFAASTQLLLYVFPVMLGIWLGLRVLARLSDWVDKGWMSEVSLVSLYTLVIWATMLWATQELHMALTALLLVAWTGITVLAYALALGPKPHEGPAPQLLVLRVFSNDSRHHNLLDVVQGRWRLLGPVHQIGGPDMVAMNVDPHEAMKFLTNRLHELFLPTGIGLADLQARLATQPDKEGRYRINEVFCFNTAWQATVVQLMQLSDVILLDVRGFNVQRGGTGFEIDQLASRGLLRRVLAVGNAQTDWRHVDELVRKAGQQPALLQRVREDELVGDELFRKLCEGAAWKEAALAGDEGRGVEATRLTR